MKRYTAVVFAAAFLLFGPGPRLNGYIVEYKEQFYRLYHLHYSQNPADTMENIYWLEQALKADFANPLHALTRIENPTEWEKYRYLFMMHLNLKVVEQYLFLGNKWNKRNAYFFNAPWKAQNLESIAVAERCFRTSLYYWNDALEWAAKAQDRRFRFIDLEHVRYWQEEAVRIERRTLDYGKTVNRELALLQKVRETFEAMDETTY